MTGKYAKGNKMHPKKIKYEHNSPLWINLHCSYAIRSWPENNNYKTQKPITDKGEQVSFWVKSESG